MSVVTLDRYLENKPRKIRIFVKINVPIKDPKGDIFEGIETPAELIQVDDHTG